MGTVFVVKPWSLSGMLCVCVGPTSHVGPTFRKLERKEGIFPPRQLVSGYNYKTNQTTSSLSHHLCLSPSLSLSVSLTPKISLSFGESLFGYYSLLLVFFLYWETEQTNPHFFSVYFKNRAFCFWFFNVLERRNCLFTRLL